MNKNTTPKKLNNTREERVTDTAVARMVRNFLRSATGATDPDVFYFSLNGMVMPLSRRA